MPKPLQPLSNDEFQRLTTDEKLSYLHEILKALLDEMSDEPKRRTNGEPPNH